MRPRYYHTDFSGGKSATRGLGIQPLENLRKRDEDIQQIKAELYWDQPLAAIADKLGQVNNLARQLRNKSKGSPNENGKMRPAEQKEYVAEFRAKLISPREEAMWKSGASNAGYHYLGCGKTLALIGQAFADAVIDLESM